MVGTNGAIIKSLNGGSVWEKQVSNTNAKLNAVTFFDAQNGIAVGNNFTFMQTSNGGNIWEETEIQVGDTTWNRNQKIDLMICDPESLISTIIDFSFSSIDFKSIDKVNNSYYIISNNFVFKLNESNKIFTPLTNIYLGLNNNTKMTNIENRIFCLNGSHLGFLNLSNYKQNSSMSWISRDFAIVHSNIKSIFSLSDNIIYGTGQNGLIFTLNNQGNVNLKWTPSEGLSNDTILSPLANPTETTTYTLTATSPYFSSIASDKITVTVQPFKSNIEIIDTISCGQTKQLDGSLGNPWKNSNIQVFDDSPFGKQFNLFFKNTKVGYISGYYYYYSTSDGGQTWYNNYGIFNFNNTTYFVNDSLGFSGSNEFSFIGPNGFYLSSSRQIFKTTNGGASWTEYQIPWWIEDKVLSFCFINKNNGFAITDAGCILKSTNMGENWIQTDSFPGNSFKAITFTDAQTGFIIGTKGALYKTTNAGNTWQKVNTYITSKLNAIQFTDSKNGYIIGNSGKVLITRDGGNEWSLTTIDKTVNLNAISMVNNKVGYIAGSKGKIYKTTNGGFHWWPMITNTTDILTTINFTDEKHGFAASDYGTFIQYSEPDGLQYSWEPSAGLSNATIAQPETQITTDQQYTVRLNSIAACGEATAKFKLVAKSEALQAFNTDTAVACGNNLMLTAKTNCYNCTNLEYEWSPSVNLSGSAIANPFTMVDTEATYTVKVTNPTACSGSNTAQAEYRVKFLKPQILVVPISPTTERLSVKGSYTSYLWSNGATTPTITVSEGTYTAIVTSANGCVVETDPHTYGSVSVKNTNRNNVFEIYPNPATNIINLSLPGAANNSTASIFDLNGRKVQTEKINTDKLQLNIQLLNKGIYLIKVENNKGVWLQKFIKE
jgi:photosystem II stability/assembly factor-like uncharacterized protein